MNNIKKNKKLIIFISIIIGILLLLSFFNIKKDSSDDKDKSLSIIQYIDDIKKNKKDGLILFIKNKKDCIDKCEIAKDNLDTLNKVYDLEYKTIKYDEHSNEYKKFIKEFKVDVDSVDCSTLYIIKKGSLIHNISPMSFSKLKRFLSFLRFIERKNEIDYKQFNKIFKMKDKSLVFIKNDDINSYKTTIEINNLSKKYKFKYNSLEFGKDGYMDLSKILEKQVDKNFATPILIVVQNQKVLDYSYETNTNKIKSFLKKNKYIK